MAESSQWLIVVPELQIFLYGCCMSSGSTHVWKLIQKIKKFQTHAHKLSNTRTHTDIARERGRDSLKSLCILCMHVHIHTQTHTQTFWFVSKFEYKQNNLILFPECKNYYITTVYCCDCRWGNVIFFCIWTD